MHYLVEECYRIGLQPIRKTVILLWRKQENGREKWEEMIELERLKEELEFLRTENAYLKKLRALRLKEEAEEQERQKLLEKWSEEDID